jgi:hypothetical protein
VESAHGLSEQVQKALVAHGAWKVRLAQAIESGSSEFSPETVRLDDQCPLGKWLVGVSDPALRQGDHFATVRRLHAQFHLAAASVLLLALSGKKPQARAAMEPGSEFATTSTRLTLALTAWRVAVDGPTR